MIYQVLSPKTKHRYIKLRTWQDKDGKWFYQWISARSKKPITDEQPACFVDEGNPQIITFISMNVDEGVYGKSITIKKEAEVAK